MNIGEILLSKYKNDELSHLYLVEPQFQDSENHCRAFTENFLSQIHPNIQHQDFLLLSRTEKKSYNLDNIAPLYEFIRYPALELKRKFFVLDEAHKLNELTINKLLKEFEEPPVPITFFLLNPRKTKLLATLKSRCTLLRVPGPTPKPSSLNFPLTDLGPEKFGKKHLKDASMIQSFLHQLSQAVSSKLTQHEALQDLQDLVQAVEKDIEYNNPLQHMQFKIYHYCSKYFMR